MFSSFFGRKKADGPPPGLENHVAERDLADIERMLTEYGRAMPKLLFMETIQKKYEQRFGCALESSPALLLEVMGVAPDVSEIQPPQARSPDWSIFASCLTKVLKDKPYGMTGREITAAWSTFQDDPVHTDLFPQLSSFLLRQKAEYLDSLLINMAEIKIVSPTEPIRFRLLHEGESLVDDALISLSNACPRAVSGADMYGPPALSEFRTPELPPVMLPDGSMPPVMLPDGSMEAGGGGIVDPNRRVSFVDADGISPNRRGAAHLPTALTPFADRARAPAVFSDPNSVCVSEHPTPSAASLRRGLPVLPDDYVKPEEFLVPPPVFPGSVPTPQRKDGSTPSPPRVAGSTPQGIVSRNHTPKNPAVPTPPRVVTADALPQKGQGVPPVPTAIAKKGSSNKTELSSSAQSFYPAAAKRGGKSFQDNWEYGVNPPPPPAPYLLPPTSDVCSASFHTTHDSPLMTAHAEDLYQSAGLANSQYIDPSAMYGSALNPNSAEYHPAGSLAAAHAAGMTAGLTGAAPPGLKATGQDVADPTRVMEILRRQSFQEKAAQGAAAVAAVQTAAAANAASAYGLFGGAYPPRDFYTAAAMTAATGLYAPPAAGMEQWGYPHAEWEFGAYPRHNAAAAAYATYAAAAAAKGAKAAYGSFYGIDDGGAANRKPGNAYGGKHGSKGYYQGGKDSGAKGWEYYTSYNNGYEGKSKGGHEGKTKGGKASKGKNPNPPPAMPPTMPAKTDVASTTPTGNPSKEPTVTTPEPTFSKELANVTPPTTAKCLSDQDSNGKISKTPPNAAAGAAPFTPSPKGGSTVGLTNMQKSPPASGASMQALKQSVLDYFVARKREMATMDELAFDPTIKTHWKAIGRIPLWKLLKQFPSELQQQQQVQGVWLISVAKQA